MTRKDVTDRAGSAMASSTKVPCGMRDVVGKAADETKKEKRFEDRYLRDAWSGQRVVRQCIVNVAMTLKGVRMKVDNLFQGRCRRE